MQRSNNRRIRQLVFAEEAFLYGARRNVVAKITGLGRREISSVWPDESPLRRNPGCMPSSADWFVGKRSNMNGVQAVHFHAYLFHQIRRGIDPLEALIVAFRLYSKKYIGREMMDFDRAYVLATMTHGFWTKEKPSLEAARCANCGALHIGHLGLGNTGRHGCPICKACTIAERKPKDLPVAATEQLPPVKRASDAMPLAAERSRAPHRSAQSTSRGTPAF